MTGQDQTNNQKTKTGLVDHALQLAMKLGEENLRDMERANFRVSARSPMGLLVDAAEGMNFGQSLNEVRDEILAYQKVTKADWRSAIARLQSATERSN